MNNSIIDQVKISLLSESEVVNSSSCEIMVPELYDSRGIPVEGGLADRRLGVIKYNELCGTCEKNVNTCTGHTGHTVLAKAVYHPLFMQKTVEILNHICPHCARLRGVNGSESESYTSPGVCPNCKQSYSTISPQGVCIAGSTFKEQNPYYVSDTQTGALVSAHTVYQLFKRIGLKQKTWLCQKLNMAGHPSDLIIKTLLIPSLRDRPSIILDNGKRNENDLSFKLLEILRANKKLGVNSEADSIGNYYHELLQYHVASYFHNELHELPISRHVGNDRPIVGIIQRLKGKQGRFRSNAVAKRVDYCMRTTITPNPQIEMDEVVVPAVLAKKLTMPEKIHRYNLEFYRALLQSGSDCIVTIKATDHMKLMVLPTNRQQCLKILEPGCTIERQIRDGDYIIINRQPTLHKLGLLAHRVVIKDQLTLSVNGGVCSPYNADFDGDQMNGLVVQNQSAYIELEQLLNLKHNTISPKNNKPAYGAVEDYLAGLFMLTHGESTYSMSDSVRLLQGINFRLDKIKSEMTGRQIFSLILPENISLQTKSGSGEPVVIVNGVLIIGHVDKKLVGCGGRLLHKVCMTYNEEVHYKLFCDLCRLGQNVINQQGLTACLSEYQLSPELNTVVRDLKVNTMAAIGAENQSTSSTPEKVINILNDFRTSCGRILRKEFSTAGESNRNIFHITNSGAKGSNLNFQQITATIGQQLVKTGLIEGDYSTQRIYSCSTKSSVAKDKGFILSSYVEGMDPTEYYSSSIAARQSLIDVQLKTKKSGYAERRLTHALQDLTSRPDLSIRTASDEIVQYAGGDSGVDLLKYSREFGLNLQNSFDFEPTDSSQTPATRQEYETALEGVIYTTPLLHQNVISECIRLRLNTDVVRSNRELIQVVLNRLNITAYAAFGILAAQSLAEPLSQMTLNSLNESGTRGDSSYIGLNKIVKLIDNSEMQGNYKTKIFARRADIATTPGLVDLILQSIVPVYLGEFSHEVDTSQYKVVITLQSQDLMDLGFPVVGNKKLYDLFMKKMNTVKAATGVNTSFEEVNESEFKITLTLAEPNASNFDELISALSTKFRLRGLMYFGGYTLSSTAEHDIIEVEGCKIKTIMKRLQADLPQYKLAYSCNDISDVLEVSGIQTARATLVQDILSVYQDQGIEMSLDNIRLLADSMCRSGVVNSIGRRGLVANKNSFLAKAAFEMPDKVLTNAAFRGEVDELKGILENIIVGSPVKIGAVKYGTKFKD